LRSAETETPMTTGNTKVIRTMCPMNCHPTFCGMLVEVEGDKLKTVSGDKDNPDSQGFLCVRGRSTNETFRLMPVSAASTCSSIRWQKVESSTHARC